MERLLKFNLREKLGYKTVSVLWPRVYRHVSKCGGITGDYTYKEQLEVVATKPLAVVTCEILGNLCVPLSSFSILYVLGNTHVLLS